jgi:hypothetical protein
MKVNIYNYVINDIKLYIYVYFLCSIIQVLVEILKKKDTLIYWDLVRGSHTTKI